MKVYSIEEIIRDVRIVLDLDKSNNSLILIHDTDALSINDIITSKITDAVKRIHITAPAYLLDGGHNLSNSVHWKDGVGSELQSSPGTGWIQLPEDFMRLICFSMSDWSTIVYNAISTDDPLYKKQSSRFKGIKGNPQKPVCIIAVYPTGRVLEFYSCKNNNATVTMGVYIPYPKIDMYGSIEICERCYTAVIYTIAMLVSITLGENEKGNYFNELAKSSLI